MTLQEIIVMASFSFGVLGLLSFALLVILYTRQERRQRRARKNTDTDKADLTILFQTMRDVVGQQKELARQFNTDLESKLNAVKQILAQSLEKNKRLYEMQQGLAVELEEAKAHVRAVQQQMTQLRNSTIPPHRAGPGAERPPLGPAAVSAPKPPPPAQDVFPPQSNTREGAPPLGFVVPPEPAPAQAAPRLEVRPAFPTPPIPRTESAATMRPAVPEKRPAPGELRVTVDEPLAGTGLTKAEFQPWVGAELGYLPAEPEEEPPVPEAPEDPEASRRAFRVLLNMPPAPSAASAAPPTDTPLPAPGGNGSATLAPMQQRVLEYSNAGMSVVQISRELGIGKGEVRLMLSLARQKGS